MKKRIEEVMEKASKGPFEVDGSGCKVIGENYYKIARCNVVGDSMPINAEREDANAALIAHCLNNFGPMLEALRRLESIARDTIGSDWAVSNVCDQAAKAIEAASQVECES